MQKRQLEQMRAEDREYGEHAQNRKHKPLAPRQNKNQPNFARYSVQELVHMREEDMEDDED